MTRFTKLVSLSAAIALVACSKKSDTAADTTAAMADTSTAASTSTTPATGITAASTTASSTGIVRININTATDTQILAIPGVGPRMLREFKEYRPYASIEQFRREIGKYVDKAEVARLEQYIYIK